MNIKRVASGLVVGLVLAVAVPTATFATDGTYQVYGATTKEECKNGQWRSFGDLYKNQGACVSSVVPVPDFWLPPLDD